VPSLPDKEDVESFRHLGWQISDIFAVLRRQEHRFHTGPQRSDELFFDAADGRDATSQGYFTLFSVHKTESDVEFPKSETFGTREVGEAHRDTN
jgi:hypothetical protein